MNEDSLEDQIDNIITKFDDLMGEAKEISKKMKSLKKEYIKLMKKSNIKNKKTVGKDVAPKGITKPVIITKELANFLELPVEEPVTRQYITKKMSEYFSNHNLQVQGDKRYMDLTKPGGPEIRKLLGVPDDVMLSYFNIQTYLKKHFVTTSFNT